MLAALRHNRFWMIRLATDAVANWKVLPYSENYRNFVLKILHVLAFLGSQKTTRHIAQESPTTIDEAQDRSPEDPVRNLNCSDIQLAGYLALAIQRTAKDAIADKPKYYTYEEWAGFIRLDRFTDNQRDEFVVDKDEQNILNWDWLGESSPLVAAQSEPEWVHGRLCNSLVRYLAIQRQSETAYREEHIHITGEH